VVTEGDKVVVRFGPAVWQCIVQTAPHPNAMPSIRFRAALSDCTTANEGITWARGWEGPAADALRALVALTS
jgi:hypothetical protein